MAANFKSIRVYSLGMMAGVALLMTFPAAKASQSTGYPAPATFIGFFYYGGLIGGCAQDQAPDLPSAEIAGDSCLTGLNNIAWVNGSTWHTDPSDNGPEIGFWYRGVVCRGGCGLPADYMYIELVCNDAPYRLISAGDNAGWCVASGAQLSIDASLPFIPGYSIVDESGHVLTQSELTLTVTQNGQPDPGVAVPLQSDRGSEDQIDDGGITNGGGIASASVSTRDQPGTSTITSASSDIETVQAGVITWLPAKYALPFLITCYAVAQESLDKSGPMVTMPGLPGEHHEGFVDNTNMQGTGKLLDGQLIQPRGSRYIPVACPWTKIGTCATTTSAAVDRLVVPKGAQIQISDIPNENRTAADIGKRIRFYHIDVFYGASAADYLDCKRFGNSPGHTVTLLGYGG